MAEKIDSARMYRCPKCKDKHIDTGDAAYTGGSDGSMVVISRVCVVCGFSWCDVFTFIAQLDFDEKFEIDEDGNIIN